MSTENKTMTNVEAMLAQYEANNKPKSANSESKIYDLKNYFNTYIGETAKSATKEIRVLPSENGTPFTEFYGHKQKTSDGWKTYPCLKHEKGQPCPFCEAADAYYAEGTKEAKEEAKKYQAKLMYILKVIDRANEDEGVKFWRFNHDYRKEGIFDKIHGLTVSFKKNRDISDPENGRDLVLTINKNATGAPIVTTIVALDPSPLSEDAEKASAWLSDDRTWDAVYATKNYDFLELVVLGKTPAWDSEEKKWVDKATLDPKEDKTDGEITMGIENVKASVKPATKKATPKTETVEVETNGEDEETYDDLPF